MTRNQRRRAVRRGRAITMAENAISYWLDVEREAEFWSNFNPSDVLDEVRGELFEAEEQLEQAKAMVV